MVVEEHRRSHSDGRTGRVLVVDDHEGVQLTLCEFLSRVGHEVTGVLSGRQALVEVDGGAYDLVVLDLALPDVSGMEVLRHIRTSASVDVIVVTGSDAEAQEEQVRQLGACAYLRKPVAFEALVRAAAAAVQRGRPRRAMGHGIVAYVSSHFTSIRSLQDVADACKVSARTVEHQVAGERGMSFQAYVRWCRIERAKGLLRATDKSMKEIAAAVGYRSPQHFSTAFRRLMETTPTAYRRRQKGGTAGAGS